MLTEEKIKAIKKELRNGVPEGEIKETLINEGYSKEDLDKIFTAHKYDMRSWYLVFAIIFLLMGLWAYLKHGSLLLLVFSALMFFQYYREIKRIK